MLLRKKQRSLTSIFCSGLLVITCGCSALDFGFGAKNESSFAWQWGWHQAYAPGPADPDSPGGRFDEEGNFISEESETAAILNFPDISAGAGVLLNENKRIASTLGIEVAEFKVPLLRHHVIQAQVGDNILGVFVGKKLLPVYEITIGAGFYRDFEEDDWVVGLGGTLIKF